MADRKRPRGEGDEVGEEALTEQENAALNEVALLQEQLDKISDEGSDRVLAIEQEYIKKKRPVYNARNDVIARIPGFWCTTLSKHPLIHGMLTSDDMAVLNHCTELDVEDCEDIKKGFKITLTFSPNNPYFSNRQLSKSLEYSEDGALSIKGTSPTWSEGYAPPADDDDEAYLGKRSAPHDYRFMMWFMDEELEPGSHDELAEIIRDDIWPNPMKFFQAGEFEPMEEGEGEELYGEGEDEVDEGVEAAGVEEDEYAPGEYDEVYEGAEAGAAGAAEGEALGTEGVGEGEEEVVIEGEEVVGEDLVEGEEAGGEQP